MLAKSRNLDGVKVRGLLEMEIFTPFSCLRLPLREMLAKSSGSGYSTRDTATAVFLP